VVPRRSLRRLGSSFAVVCVAVAVSASTGAGAHHVLRPLIQVAPNRPKAITVRTGATYTLSLRSGSAVAAFGAGRGIAVPSTPFSFRASSARLVIVAPRESVTAVLVAGTPAPTIFGRGPNVRGSVMSADLAVFGGDTAGLAAAITAARRGLRVVLLCSDSLPGGMLTVGDVGFADGNPVYSWDDDGSGSDGQIPSYTAWATTGGFWRDFRQAVIADGAPDDGLPALRWSAAASTTAVRTMIAALPNLRVLNESLTTHAVTRAGRVVSVHVESPEWSGTVRAPYWVDGTDTGTFIGELGLPSLLGDSTRPAVPGPVMAYAYRWTAVEGSVPGRYPRSPPPYYSINRLDYRGATTERWPSYQTSFRISNGQSYDVQPFRLFNRLGRLTGGIGEETVDDNGDRLTDSPPLEWNVNGAMNDVTTAWLAELLASNDEVAALFARNDLADPYRASNPSAAWSDIDWVQQSAPLHAPDKVILIADIRDAVRSKAEGLLWYIRSGEMLDKLHTLPGGQGLRLRANWSYAETTSSGLPEKLYTREGRRVVGDYYLTVQAACPTFVSDAARPLRTCTSSPAYFSDGVAISDFPIDIHGTGTTPSFAFALVRPQQVPFRALIPRGISNLLVGGAISADRFEYAALRVDPVRAMIGTALGEAAVQALRSRQSSFKELAVAKLRETLAFDHQESVYEQWAPRWEVGQGWRDDGIGTAMQVLSAAGLFEPAWRNDPGDGKGWVAPALLLDTETLRALVARGLRLPRHLSANPRNRSVKLRAIIGGNSRRNATVGDLYVWLASRVINGAWRSLCGASGEPPAEPTHRCR
jgi:hypothetical protein